MHINKKELQMPEERIDMVEAFYKSTDPIRTRFKIQEDERVLVFSEYSPSQRFFIRVFRTDLFQLSKSYDPKGINYTLPYSGTLYTVLFNSEKNEIQTFEGKDHYRTTWTPPSDKNEKFFLVYKIKEKDLIEVIQDILENQIGLPRSPTEEIVTALENTLK